MPSLADVFRVIERMREDGAVSQYAIGGATAALFYAEPVRTYDVDVFVVVPDAEDRLSPVSGVYRWAREEGFEIESEHILVHGVPVQILPAYNPLVAEAIDRARLALQAGGARRRERAWQLLESGAVDRARLRDLLRIHEIAAEVPEDA